MDKECQCEKLECLSRLDNVERSQLKGCELGQTIEATTFFSLFLSFGGSDNGRNYFLLVFFQIQILLPILFCSLKKNEEMKSENQEQKKKSCYGRVRQLHSSLSARLQLANLHVAKCPRAKTFSR